MLHLAEHAITAPSHADRIADEPGGPALQLSVDRGICLPSHGQPAVADAAVYAGGFRSGTPWPELVHATGSEQPFTVGLPLADQYRLIDQLRNAADSGYTTLALHLLPGGLRLGARREPATHRPQPRTAGRPGLGHPSSRGRRKGRPFPLHPLRGHAGNTLPPSEA